MKPRVVFDCMVYLQAVSNPSGPSGACIKKARDHEVELLVNSAILAEIQDVLTREETLIKFRKSLTSEIVEIFLLHLLNYCVQVDQVSDSAISVRDPKDQPYLNLAVAAGAFYLVSRDRDLLDLRDDPAFHAAHPKLRILEPQELLETLRTAPPR